MMAFLPLTHQHAAAVDGKFHSLLVTTGLSLLPLATVTFVVTRIPLVIQTTDTAVGGGATGQPEDNNLAPHLLPNMKDTIRRLRPDEDDPFIYSFLSIVLCFTILACFLYFFFAEFLFHRIARNCELRLGNVIRRIGFGIVVKVNFLIRIRFLC